MLRKIARVPFTFIFFWWILVTLAILLQFSQRIENLPPFWDSLSYQIYGLQFARDASIFSKYLNQSIPWGWIFPVALSFKISDFSNWGPFYLSALWSLIYLFSIYWLMRILRVNRFAALVLVFISSSFPTFLYQNFLQTRNDYPAATFLVISFCILITATEKRSTALAFGAGLMAGLSTLVKLSMPGYFFFPLVLFLFGVGSQAVPFPQRLKLLVNLFFGFCVAAGWYYFLEFKSIVSYYQFWGQMVSWRNAQYGLNSLFDLVIFYPKIFWNYHMPAYGKWAAGSLLLFSLWVAIVKSKKVRLAHLPRFDSPLWLALAFGFLPLAFLTLRSSLSQLGDIPCHPFIWSSFGVLITPAFHWLEERLGSNRKGPLFAALGSVGLLLLALGLTSIVPEGPTESRDFAKFESATLQIKKDLKMTPDIAIAIFSHPFYNLDAALWAWEKRGETAMPLHSTIYFYDVFRSEDPEEIYLAIRKVARLVVTSRQNLEPFGGEIFHTLNRHKADLEHLVQTRGDYIPYREVPLEDGKLVLDYWVWKEQK